MIRDTSRMSSISCACRRALRAMVSRAWSPVLAAAPGLEQVHPAQDGVERRPQFVRQRGEEFVLGAARLLGDREPGQFRLLAPRRHDAHARQPHRLAVPVLDPPLAFEPAHGAIGRDDAVLDVVRDASVRARWPRRARARDPRGGSRARSSRRCRRRRPPAGRAAGQVLRPLHLVGREVPVPRAHRRRIEREPKSMLVAARVSSAVIRSTANATCDAIRLASCISPAPGTCGVSKYSMNLPITRSMLTSGRRRAPRCLRLEDGRRRRATNPRDVADDDRDGVRIRRPGAVTLDGSAILVRDTARGDKPHHARGVEQEDRGAITCSPASSESSAGVEDLLDGATAADRLGQVEDSARGASWPWGAWIPASPCRHCRGGRPRFHVCAAPCACAAPGGNRQRTPGASDFGGFSDRSATLSWR